MTYRGCWVRTKRSREGELIIDHRASPGLTPEQVGAFNAPAVGKGDIYESAIAVCGHCQFAVILEPNRSRDRGWCSKCDTYLCDECTELLAKTLECRSMKRRVDEAQELIERYGSTQLILGKD